MKLSVTSTALEKLLKLKAEEVKFKLPALKVSVLGGGCSGLQYGMEWVEFDEVFDFLNYSLTTLPYQVGFERTEEGQATAFVDFIVDKKSGPYLDGATLDYDGGLNGKGFQFTNPDWHHVCGCGTSFGV